MIQRKQTLFLLQLVLFSIAMLFVPHQIIYSKANPYYVCMLPLVNYSSTTFHIVAMALNFLALVITFVTIFLYKKRELQVKLCYFLILLWLAVLALLTFCPFLQPADTIIEIKKNYFGYLCSAFAILAAYLATVFIKKDIELLKSADRIR